MPRCSPSRALLFLAGFVFLLCLQPTAAITGRGRRMLAAAAGPQLQAAAAADQAPATLPLAAANASSLIKTVPEASAGTQISSSVIMFNHQDWDPAYTPDGLDWSSPCIDMLYRAASSEASVVNFVITHYWIDEAGDGVVDEFCMKDGWGQGCSRVDAQAIERFRSGMQSCFFKAVQMGLSIAITPHLDDGLERGGWRNALTLDPLAMHGSHSYWDVMLQPLAQALNRVIAPGTEVWFAMQGEMSATVMRHPDSYSQLIPMVKQALVAGRPDAAELLRNIRVGVSTNFNKLCACVLMDLVDPNEYLDKLPAALSTVIQEFNVSAIQRLYDTVDLIGISSYAGLTADFQEPSSSSFTALGNAIWQFQQEIALFGVDLKDVVMNRGTAFVLSEYGVGGGLAQNGSVPATTAAEAARYPFFGIFGIFNASTDPWKTWEPESVDVPTRTWRRRFFNETSSWLLHSGAPPWRVDGLYLWNLASWDVQAVNYFSYSGGSSYRDEVVADGIRAHNALVASQHRQLQAQGKT